MKLETIRRQLITTFIVRYDAEKQANKDMAQNLLSKLVDMHQYSIANGGVGLNPLMEQQITEAIIKEKGLESTTDPDYTELVEAVAVGFEQKNKRPRRKNKQEKQDES